MKKQSTWRVNKAEKRIPKKSKKKSFVSNDMFFNGVVRPDGPGSKRDILKPKQISNFEKNQVERNANKSHKRMPQQCNKANYNPETNLMNRKKDKNLLFKENRGGRLLENHTQREIGAVSKGVEQGNSRRKHLKEVHPVRNGNQNIQAYPARNARRSKEAIREPGYLKRPQYKEENDLEFEKPTAPHNPWLQNGNRLGMVQQNLNQAAFHIYPVNRKQPKLGAEEKPSPDSMAESDWKPVTRIIKTQAKNRKQFIQQSFGAQDESFILIETPEVKKPVTATEVSGGVARGNIFAAPVQDKRYKNKQQGELNDCSLSVNKIKKVRYNNQKQTLI